jgi:hypothetical protein
LLLILFFTTKIGCRANNFTEKASVFIVFTDT